MTKGAAIAASVFLFVLLATLAVAQALVTEDVVRDAPVVLNGDVLAVEQVGQTIIVGGNFTQVEATRNGTVIDQPALFTYDADTGVFNTDFRPILSNNGNPVEVTDIEPAPDGRSVYISGNFLRINDRSDDVDRFRGRIARIDLITGEVSRIFAQGSPSAAPSTITYSGGWLYVGGSFTSVNDSSTGQTVTHELRGLARFDGETGAFDPGFIYESGGEDIGRSFDGVREFGVSDIDITPDGTSLVVAHRGSEFHDIARGTFVEAGGVAIIGLNNNGSHGIRGFQALYPDPDDPIQEFYHAGQCDNRGVQIRDVEVSPDSSYFITVGQGADSGYQCDSVTRWEITSAAVRPTWVSRAFDSLFSVAVAEDAIYIGGHHRYQVHPDAPSPFPGVNVPGNGQRLADRSQVYIADPTDTRSGGRAFLEDLVEPGFVYPVGQIGAINPETGYGIPEWTPSSNAQVGVLDLTLTGRGLLLGQDNDRVNNIETGRAAFFDDLPGSGAVTCTADVNDQGRVVLNWNNTGSVDSFDVFQNGSFFATTGDSTFTDTATISGTNFYEVRFIRNSQNLEASCGSVALGTASLTCTATIDANNNVLIDWNDNRDWDRITVLRDGGFVTTEFDQDDFTDSPGPGTYNYTLRGFLLGTQIDADCGTITVEIPEPAVALTCSATLQANDDVIIDWNTDVDWDRVTLLRDGRWLTTRSNVAAHTDSPGLGTFEYTARAFLNGFQFDANCGSATVAPEQAPAAQCTAVIDGGDITLTWDDRGLSTYIVRRDSAWIATVRNATTPETRTFTTPFIDGVYEIRYWVNGTPFDIACTLEGPPAPAPAPEPEPAPVGPLTNLALNQPATQSSTFSDNTRYAASEGVDGDTRGANSQRSITHTKSESQPWWEVDLGTVSALEQIQIWNRTDTCCVTRLSNYSVFVSDTPFTGQSLEDLQADGSVTEYFFEGAAGRPTTIDVTGVNGQYVRIQLHGTNSLQFAEVIVLGRQ